MCRLARPSWRPAGAGDDGHGGAPGSRSRRNRLGPAPSGGPHLVLGRT
jgi:hypothetical protein